MKYEFIFIFKNDLVHKLLDQFKKKFNDSEEYVILRASQLFKEKRLAEAEKCLRVSYCFDFSKNLKS